MDSPTLTCVYCGTTYPEGTPPFGSKILTDHIRVCEKHPMRDLEIRYAKVRGAMLRMAGVSDMSECKAMICALNTIPGNDEQKAAAINLLEVLLETA